MTKKVKILEISRMEKISKRTNRPFVSVGIKIQGKSGPVWVNGFESPQTKTWAQGSEVEIELEQNGKYWNFKPVPLDLGRIVTLLEAIAEKVGVKLPTKVEREPGLDDDLPPPPMDEDAPPEFS